MTIPKKTVQAIIFLLLVVVVAYFIIRGMNFDGVPLMTSNEDSYILPGTVTRDFSILDTLQLYNHKIDQIFVDFPLVVRISLFVVIASSITMLFIVFHMFKTLFDKKNKERKEKRFTEEYVNGFRELLSIREAVDVQEAQRIVGVKDGYWVDSNEKAQMWLKLYLRLFYADHEFKNHDNMLRLSEGIGLIDYCQRILLTGDPQSQSRILQTIRLGRLPVSEGSLSRLINHKNKSLRKSARLLYMMVNNNNPYHFMETDSGMTTWDAIELHASLLLQQQENRTLPSFLSLTRHANSSSYVSFLLREWAFMDKETVTNELLEYLHSSDEDIRVAAVDAAAIRKDLKAVEIMKEIYPVAKRTTRKKILEALLEIQAGNDEAFMQNAFLTGDSFYIKLAALRTLQAYSPLGKMVFDRLAAEAIPKERILFKHIESEKSFSNSNKGYQLAVAKV